MKTRFFPPDTPQRAVGRYAGCFLSENAHVPALPRPDVRASSTMRLRATGALLGRTDRHQRGSPALVHDDVRARGRDAERRLRFHSISPGSPKRSVGKNTGGAAPAHTRWAESTVVTSGACVRHGDAAANGFSAAERCDRSRSQLSEQRLRVWGWPHLHERAAASAATGSSTESGGKILPCCRGRHRYRRSNSGFAAPQQTETTQGRTHAPMTR